MKVIREIHSIEFYCSKAVPLKVSIPSAIHFPSRCANHKIRFTANGLLIDFPLTHYTEENINHFKAEEGKEFNSEVLKEMAMIFGFELKEHPYASQTKRGIIPSYPGLTLYAGFLKTDSTIFSILYVKWGETDFEDNQYYIHKFVELESDQFLKSILH